MNGRNRIKTLVIVGAGLALGCNSIIAKTKPDRPNIILILADDLGYGDLSCFRGDGPWKTNVKQPEDFVPIQTPNLDALAKRGMMMTDFHSNCSLCSPTRAAIMTGRYNHRTGICNVLGQLGNAIRKVNKPGEELFLGLRLDEVTIAEVLKQGGYRTGMFGKWHLGPMKTHHPLDQGFEDFVGTGGGSGDCFAMKAGAGTKGKSYFMRGCKTVDAPGYWHTDVMADEVIKYVSRKSDKPFFAYVPFTAPHVPLIGPSDKELANNWNAGPSETYGKGPRKDKIQAYKDVVEGLDAAIGRILAALDKQGLTDNTLVIFTSDNGPIGYGSAGRYRGNKSTLYEGGTRVPTIITWPDIIAADSKSDELTMGMDLFPTLAIMGKCKLDKTRKLDGVDLSGLLTEGKPLEKRMLFWEKPLGAMMVNFHNRRWTVRDGNWALVKENMDKPIALFELGSDPGQRKDLSAKYPERVAKMKKAFEIWKKDVYADSPWDIDEYMKRFEKAGVLKK